MKRFRFLLFIGCCLWATSNWAQVKTPNFIEGISINGLKYGYIYTLEQIKKALGEPAEVYSWPDDDYGTGYEIHYDKDLIIRFYDDTRALGAGINEILLDTNKYALNIDEVLIKVGDPLAKIETLPHYTGLEKRDDNEFIVVFNNIVAETTLMIRLSEKNIVTYIFFGDLCY